MNTVKLRGYQVMKSVRSSDLLTVCCECGRIRLGNNWWREEEIVVNGNGFTHGYCPSCFRMAYMTISSIRSEFTEKHIPTVRP